MIPFHEIFCIQEEEIFDCVSLTHHNLVYEIMLVYSYAFTSFSSRCLNML